MQESVRESNFYRMHKMPLLEGLNEAQCKAVMHGEGPALVAAGPGSGKTLTMIRRVLYLLLERKIPAEKILVITYTKDAAISMQEKFNQQLKKFQNFNMSHYCPVQFGTFHSCFYQIVKSHPEIIGWLFCHFTCSQKIAISFFISFMRFVEVT